MKLSTSIYGGVLFTKKVLNLYNSEYSTFSKIKESIDIREYYRLCSNPPYELKPPTERIKIKTFVGIAKSTGRACDPMGL